jgi:hypothetical protein
MLDHALRPRIMARPRRKRAAAHLAQLAAHGLLGDGDAKFLEHPLAKIDDPPAHNAMDRRRWTVLDHFHQRRAVPVIELWSLSGRFAVDESVRATVQPQFLRSGAASVELTGKTSDV